MFVGKGDIQQEQGAGEDFVYTDYFSDSEGNIEETMPMLLTCCKKKYAVAKQREEFVKKSIPPKRNAII